MCLCHDHLHNYHHHVLSFLVTKWCNYMHLYYTDKILVGKILFSRFSIFQNIKQKYFAISKFIQKFKFICCEISYQSEIPAALNTCFKKSKFMMDFSCISTKIHILPWRTVWKIFSQMLGISYTIQNEIQAYHKNSWKVLLILCARSKYVLNSCLWIF